MPFAATWMELETLIMSEVSQKLKDKYHMIPLISAQMNLSTEKKTMDLENRLVVAKVEGKGVGWMGCLGLIDADYLFILLLFTQHNLFSPLYRMGTQLHIHVYIIFFSHCHPPL